MLKRFIAVTVSALTLAAAATPAFASTRPSHRSHVPHGTYAAYVSQPTSLEGHWKIKFDSGTDSDYLNGTQVASGTYTLSGRHTIKFATPAGGACSTPGTYSYKLTRTTLTFTKISDPCNAIRSELLSRTFTKIWTHASE